jgi:hypothetical protein
MAIEELPIFSYYNKQRFIQYGSGDLANWYGIAAPDTKKVQALYPSMGRKHISYFGQNMLIFNNEPSAIFRTIDNFYVIDGTSVIWVDKNYTQTVIGNLPLGATCWFDYMPVNNLIYGLLTTGSTMYVIIENGNTVTFNAITDPVAPKNAQYVATFGNRFVVNQTNTSTFFLSAVQLGPVPFNPAICFQATGGGPVTNIASGVIRQFGVLHNQLYIFNDFTTDVWANITSQNVLNNVNTTPFPWKQNTSYNFDYGIADPDSLDIDFGMMVWLGQNKNGLVSILMSTGGQPKDISSQAVNVLIQGSTNDDSSTPFITPQGTFNVSDGFLYQYENSIFYRISAGLYTSKGQLDINDNAVTLEYNFGIQKWARAIELNGERNRIQRHIFFNNKHLVTLQGDPAMYEMAGNIYYNEVYTTGVGPQEINTFTKYPMRYELVTQQIFQPDYSEFLTDYVEIDFVFGDRTFYKSDAPFDNTVFVITEDADHRGCPIFVITEDADADGQPIFVITEDGNTPGFDDNHYNSLFKPNIGLYYSDDGGVTFTYADLREFSQLGQYRWRMRWYELGASRNRCYKLVCVSSAPIVVLGAVQDVRRSSGGAN